MEMQNENKESGLSGVLQSVDSDITTGKSGDFEMPTITIEVDYETDAEIYYKMPPTKYSRTVSALMNNVGAVNNVVILKGQSYGKTGTQDMIIIGFSVLKN